MRARERGNRMLGCVLIAVGAIAGGAAAATPVAGTAPAPALWQGLEPGAHGVGFKTVYLFDDTRAFHHAAGDGTAYQGRPVRLMIWYPGKQTAKAGMPFSAYSAVRPGDDRFAAVNDLLVEQDVDTARRQFSPPTDELFDALMSTPTAAHENLPEARGRYPLLVHSLGRNDFQQESTVLWEYLASHGYVVATVPQLGSSPENPRLAFTPGDVEIQARDVEYALSALVRAANVDAGRTALLGHSAGGVVALLVASRNPNVDAVVSLEGSISTADGTEIMGSMEWSPENVRIPVLNLYAGGKQGLDLAVLDLLSGAHRYHGALGSGAPPRQATHFDFQNWPLYSVLTGTDDPRGLHFRNAEMGKEFYLTACRLTREFLDGTLKNDPAWRQRFAATAEVEIENDLGKLSHQAATADARVAEDDG